MNFLANETFPVVGIKLLRNAGHNVASVIEASPGEKDGIILKRSPFIQGMININEI